MNSGFRKSWRARGRRKTIWWWAWEKVASATIWFTLNLKVCVCFMLAWMWGQPHEGLLPRATHINIKPDMLSWRLDSSSFFGSEMPFYSTCSRLSYSPRLLIDPSTSSRTLGVIQPLRVNTQLIESGFILHIGLLLPLIRGSGSEVRLCYVY